MVIKEKRGLSSIVATLIIILLAIVAFGIVSNVINDEVGDRAEGVSLSSQCLDFEFDSASAVNDTDAGHYNVTLDRTASGKEMEGAKVQLVNSDETQSATGSIDEKIEALDTITRKVDFNNGSSLGFSPAKIEVTPYLTKEDGEEYLCDNPFSSEQVTN